MNPMNPLSRCFSLIAAAALALCALYMDTSAHAVAAFPSYWTAEIPTGVIADVPLPGYVVIPARVVSGNCSGGASSASSLFAVTITVTDAGGAEQPGELRYENALGSVVWEASSPLQSGATYDVYALFDNVQMEDCGFGGGFQGNIEGAFQITLASSSLGAPSQPSEVRGLLTESSQTDYVCCPIEHDPTLCDPRLGCATEHCWADAYTYQPALELTWTEGGTAAEQAVTSFEVVRITAAGEEVVTTAQAAGTVTVTFDESAERYCARVRTLSPLNDQQTDSADFCLDASQLVPVTRQSPPKPDLSPCTSLPPGYANEDDCGCELTRAAPANAPSTPLLALLLVAGGSLIVSRRRR